MTCCGFLYQQIKVQFENRIISKMIINILFLCAYARLCIKFSRDVSCTIGLHAIRAGAGVLTPARKFTLSVPPTPSLCDYVTHHVKDCSDVQATQRPLNMAPACGLLSAGPAFDNDSRIKVSFWQSDQLIIRFERTFRTPGDTMCYVLHQQ